MYYHGESISVNVHIQNNSNKTVKKIKVSIIQVADICLFTTASYTCEVAKVDSGLVTVTKVLYNTVNQCSEGFPVGPGGTLSKVYSCCPLLTNNKDKRGLALDGQLKHEDTNLASSTLYGFLNLAPKIMQIYCRMHEKLVRENLGIVVQYKVRVRLAIGGALGGELVAELPFTLTHPKPPDSPQVD